jgi:hypothetical protein
MIGAGTFGETANAGWIDAMMAPSTGTTTFSLVVNIPIPLIE